jgi:hypothetical protein
MIMMINKIFKYAVMYYNYLNYQALLTIIYQTKKYKQSNLKRYLSMIKQNKYITLIKYSKS